MNWLGMPCWEPPFGELVALDMHTGDVKWRRPLGASQQYGFFMPEKWGSPTIGGPAVTAGGVIFIGASMDAKLRAFSLKTGEQLWSDQAQARPWPTLRCTSIGAASTSPSLPVATPSSRIRSAIRSWSTRCRRNDSLQARSPPPAPGAAAGCPLLAIRRRIGPGADPCRRRGASQPAGSAVQLEGDLRHAPALVAGAVQLDLGRLA